jgi:hypothetical protein
MEHDSSSQAFMAKNAKRDLYDWLDMLFKAASLSAALWAAFLAIGAYQKDLKEKIVDQRIKAFNDALEAAGKVVLARDWDTYERAIDEFGAVKHGQVVAAMGKGTAYLAMVTFYNKAVEVWNNNPYSGAIPQDQLGNAFEELADTFSAAVRAPVDLLSTHAP